MLLTGRDPVFREGPAGVRRAWGKWNWRAQCSPIVLIREVGKARQLTCADSRGGRIGAPITLVRSRPLRRPTGEEAAREFFCGYSLYVVSHLVVACPQHHLGFEWDAGHRTRANADPPRLYICRHQHLKETVMRP